MKPALQEALMGSATIRVPQKHSFGSDAAWCRRLEQSLITHHTLNEKEKPMNWIAKLLGKPIAQDSARCPPKGHSSVLSCANSPPHGALQVHAEAFCPRPHILIGNIGSSEHGKTTVSRALAARASVLAGAKENHCVASFRNLFDAKGMVDKGSSVVDYEHAARHYIHIDPNNDEDVMALVTHGVPLDVVLMVVAANEGPIRGLQDMLLCARSCGPKPVGRTQVVTSGDNSGGSPKLIILINKTDFMYAVNDDEITRLIENEVRELAKWTLWHPDDTTIIRGSAERALHNPDNPADAKCMDSILSVIGKCEPAAEQRIRS